MSNCVNNTDGDVITDATESNATEICNVEDVHVISKYIINTKNGEIDDNLIDEDDEVVTSIPEHTGGSYCTFLLQGKECHKPNCPHYHNLEEFLKCRPKDLPFPCPFYETYGKCPYGVNCRFGKDHIDPITGENKIKPDFIEPPQMLNIVSNSEMAAIRKMRGAITDEDLTNFETTPIEKSSKDIIQKQSEENEKYENNDILKKYFKAYNGTKGSNKMFCLAPMCTVGTLPFRRLCAALYFRATGKRLATCSEMIFAKNILQGDKFEFARIKRHPDEKIFGIQMCTNNSLEYTRVFKYLAATNKCNFIDLNAACPQDVATKCGYGAKLTEKTSQLRHILCSGKMPAEKNNYPGVAATLKIRIGDFYGTLRGEEIITKIGEEKANIDGIFIHGRTARQRYTQTADWDYLEKCRTLFQSQFKNATFGYNGDVFGPEDIEKVINEDEGRPPFILVGRGALIKPWIFEELETGKRIDKTANERMEILKEYARYLLEFYGTDKYGINKARINFLENCSFFCRYIPHGIIEEGYPQKMNQRTVQYRGRNKLESLLGSNEVSDWIKISEQLFGRVDKEFTFSPKHKSRSF